MSADLFGEAPIAGLDYRPGSVTAGEERALIAHLSAEDLSPFRFQGWTGKRETASYGWRYDFDDRSFGPADPIPGFLMEVRAAAAALAGLAPADFVHALVTRYAPGAGIGWHRDRPVFEHVVGLSLGGDALLRFRRRRGTGFERRALPVPARSLYHLSGEARWEWEHSIAPIEEARWSVTFRSLAAGHGRAG